MEIRHYWHCAVFTALLAILSLTLAADPVEGDVRLRDGQNPAEGRVEVYHNGAWGTICDDGFDLTDANVICRQLNYSSANASHCCAHFTHGSGAILIDDIACIGTETSISACPHRGWGQHNCAHTEDASVTCNGNIRLEGSNSTIQGRVEVYQNDAWGTVCATGWDLVDGDMVCRQLGFPGANDTYSDSRFGVGTGPVALTNVGCTGQEEDFFHCANSSTPGPECNNHAMDASVKCNRLVRLTGGRNLMEGYVEVYDGYRWSPICAKDWDINDARVVCKQVGDLAAIEATSGMRFGQTTSSYLLSRVGCSGQESSLDECPSTTTGNADCFRFSPVGNDPYVLNNTSDLAGVRCSPAVRLASDGSSFLKGRVEVFIDGNWGGVCADGWDRRDAQVVCQQLGEYPLANSCCEASTERISNGLMHGLNCSGNEKRLQDCTYTQDTGTCQAAVAECQVTVRLTGGPHSLEGNVEISRNGVWGSICDDNWGLEDAQVVCRQLGNYEVVSHSCCSKYTPLPAPYLLDDVGCTGDEGRIEDCYHSDWGSHNCGNSEAAGVSCRNFRLISEDVNTNSPKGRVEAVHNGIWGRVCGLNWDMNDANVLCRQLYNSTAESLGADSFQSGSGMAFMTNFNCVGTEASLLDCPRDEGELDDCTTDATVVCKGGIRLVGGESPLEGRVEIFHDGQWGTVCDDGWDIADAQVVCKQLGNYAALAAKCCQEYGPGSGPILMDGVNCAGTEATLESCPHEGWQSHNCQHYEDASAICTDIKLTAENGSTSTSLLGGRVEILLDGQWKSVCSKGWDTNAAQVVCTQLYNTDVKNVTYYLPVPGQETGMNYVSCNGDETKLTECQSMTTDVVCPTKYRAGIECKDIRLVGGSVPSEGAVEILLGGEWGLICGNDWGSQEGVVACRQLGYCSSISTQRGWDPSIDERNVMHWHSMNCSGVEDHLRDCPKLTGSFPCGGYNFEAAVVCKNWCDPPPYQHHGSWRPRMNKYDLRSRISFTCDDGYELNGSRIRECLDVCTWSGGNPVCEKITGPSGNTHNEQEASGGIHPAGLFFIGLTVGVLLVILIIGTIWYFKQKPAGSPARAGNIFRPRKPVDEMEEPVLSFSSMNDNNEDDGDVM